LYEAKRRGRNRWVGVGANSNTKTYKLKAHIGANLEILLDSGALEMVMGVGPTPSV